MITSLLWFALAAVAEIIGCFAFWSWIRGESSAWWLIGGVAALAGFAAILAKIDLPHAGRAYAAYGGIYIVASVAWLWLADGIRPTLSDLGGAGLAIAGTLVILAGSSTH